MNFILAELLPGEDGHGLFYVDVDVVLPRLPAVVEEVVAGEHVLPSRYSGHLAEICNETFSFRGWIFEHPMTGNKLDWKSLQQSGENVDEETQSSILLPIDEDWQVPSQPSQARPDQRQKKTI